GIVRLNYLVDAASWHPAYKLRAGNGNKDAVGLEYLAAVVQQTGEDWSGVSMTLSTAQPMLNASPPDLKALAVGIVNKVVDLASVAPMPVPNPPGNRGEGRGGQAQPGQPGFTQGGFNADNRFANPSGRLNAKDLSEQSLQLKKQAQEEANM